MLIVVSGVAVAAVLGAVLASGTGTIASAIPVMAPFVFTTIVLSAFLDHFRRTLRTALLTSFKREKDLEQIRESLEVTVTERTASLQLALESVEQRGVHLAQTLADLRISEATVRELSAPVIPLMHGVLIVPLVGALDSARAADLMNNVLSAVERFHARYVIFDITGVPIVDTQVAKSLLETTAAAQLLGARSLLVGIRPEVAHTIVSLGIDLGSYMTFSDLQEAVEALLMQAKGSVVMRAKKRTNGSQMLLSSTS
jgi:anti-anti-sigma regulatory factor